MGVVRLGLPRLVDPGLELDKRLFELDIAHSLTMSKRPAPSP
jgi:hypothetical protein